MRVPLLARTRRLAVVLAAAAGLVATASTTPAMAWSANAHGAAATSSGRGAGPATYLALGDSVPFGYRGNLQPAQYANPKNFVGYPEVIARQTGLRLVNASCPGETTDSFINPTAQSNGCENTVNPTPGGPPVVGGYRTNYPLHVPYSYPTESQLKFAIDVLKSRNVQLVTLMVGANDTFVCQKTTADQCANPAEIQAVARHVQANLDYILQTLRNEGHYGGKIVVVNYYALDYSAPTVAGTAILDQAMVAAAGSNGDTLASGFLAFLPIAVAKGGGNSIKAGLVLPNDVHPTALGQQVLAAAVESVVRRPSRV